MAAAAAAAAAGDSMQHRIADIQADIGEAKQQLQGATGDKEVALQQRLAALEQQKLLLMQQQSGATGWAHSQGAGLLVTNLSLFEQMFYKKLHF
jgi:hypothetical protein